MTALRTKVNHIVRGFNHVQVMFDDDDRVARIDKPVERVEQFLDVCQMQPGRRFVKNVEIVFAAFDFAKFP